MSFVEGSRAVDKVRGGAPAQGVEASAVANGNDRRRAADAKLRHPFVRRNGGWLPVRRPSFDT